MAFNNVQLLGRFSAKPEMMFTTGGTEISNFTLAVDKPYNKEHEHPEANWIDCVAFGKTAQFISEKFDKGNKVLIEGRLDTSNYTDKDGNKRKSTKVVVSNIHFIESKKDSDGGQQTTSPQKQNSTMQELSGFENIEESELPF